MTGMEFSEARATHSSWAFFRNWVLAGTIGVDLGCKFRAFASDGCRTKGTAGSCIRRRYGGMPDSSAETYQAGARRILAEMMPQGSAVLDIASGPGFG
jgi:hypothetical protein